VGAWVLGCVVYFHRPFIFNFGLGWPEIYQFLAETSFLSILCCSGFFLCAALGGLWAGLNAAEDADGSIRIAFRNHLPGYIGALVAMSWYAAWMLPKKIAARRNRIRISPDSN
jgi:hypothetical protein